MEVAKMVWWQNAVFGLLCFGGCVLFILGVVILVCIVEDEEEVMGMKGWFIGVCIFLIGYVFGMCYLAEVWGME